MIRVRGWVAWALALRLGLESGLAVRVVLGNQIVSLS